MQLHALDRDKNLVFAAHAAKQKDYFCLECQGIVRRRGGSHRHVHYYHLAASHSCRLSGKSMTHLQIQYYLHSLLPKNECFLEFRFPSINRIADVVWETKKIIFEVQCSAISAEEVTNRNRDYASLGYQVVWILHDQRYNQPRMSLAEQFLLDSPHYFSNMNAEGNGIIYDQFALTNKGVRQQILQPLSVKLHELEDVKVPSGTNLPQVVVNRLNKWPVYFSGDLLHLCFKKERSLEEESYLSDALLFEASIDSLKNKPLVWWQKLQRAYWLIFQSMLERACK